MKSLQSDCSKVYLEILENICTEFIPNDLHQLAQELALYHDLGITFFATQNSLIMYHKGMTLKVLYILNEGYYLYVDNECILCATTIDEIVDYISSLLDACLISENHNEKGLPLDESEEII